MINDYNDLNYIGRLVIDSYRENIKDESYINEKIELLFENNNKLDSLYSVLNMDQKNRDTLAKKLGTSKEDFSVFLEVLKKV